MRKYNRVFGVLGFIAVESFFYFKSGRDNLEMFFMIWVFISAALIFEVRHYLIGYNDALFF